MCVSVRRSGILGRVVCEFGTGPGIRANLRRRRDSLSESTLVFDQDLIEKCSASHNRRGDRIPGSSGGSILL